MITDEAEFSKRRILVEKLIKKVEAGEPLQITNKETGEVIVVPGRVTDETMRGARESN